MDAIATSVHEFTVLEKSGRYVGGCACGWSGGVSITDESAQQRWAFHLAQCSAVATAARSCTLAAEARERARALVAARAELRSRRVAIAVERRQLRERLRTARAYLRGGVAPNMLETARELADMTHGDLWVEYFALGGNISERDLRDALIRDEPLPPRDRELLSIALNERFTELGLGRPLDIESDPWS